MSAKTLNAVQLFSSSALASEPLTYSIAPASTSFISQTLSTAPAELESFLEDENPLGCIRGVLWVMGFNAAAFLIGYTIWAACAHL